MGLRLREGVPVETIAPALNLGAVERLERQGLVRRDAGRLFAAQPLLLDGILGEIAL
jgi:hypothetical protein